LLTKEREKNEDPQEKEMTSYLSKLTKYVSLRDNTVAQKALTFSSPDSPHFSDHFHLLLSIFVMYN
jgi:hypothetical protein